ncbi:ion channel [Agathobacter rectalis]|uniref:ion channel n=1 Tax=Agathobacter rectalis TaxID=39491 RepID=UPI0027D317C2|nr:ion channel [Agathobacter rectalis]
MSRNKLTDGIIKLKKYNKMFRKNIIKDLRIRLFIWLDILNKWRIYFNHILFVSRKLPKSYFYENFKDKDEYTQIVYNKDCKIKSIKYLYSGKYQKYLKTPYRYFQKFADKDRNIYFIEDRNGESFINKRKNKIVNIKKFTYYEGITFVNITFENIELDNVCFHNCKFECCEFIKLRGKTNWYMKFKQGFSACDFIDTCFNDCDINSMFFSIGVLRYVKFINCNFNNTILHRLVFDHIEFEGKTDLHNFFISHPARLFDVNFENSIDDFHMGCNCFFSDLDVKDNINYTLDEIIENKKSYKKRGEYNSASNTFFQLEYLMKSVGARSIEDLYVDLYYNRKKAETRGANFKNKIGGYFSEFTIGYGEKPLLCLNGMLFLIFIFGIIYLFSGFRIDNSDVIVYKIGQSISVKEFVGQLLQSMYFSFFTLVTVGQGNIAPAGNVSHFMMAIELILGAIFVTLFTATLFRKITK